MKPVEITPVTPARPIGVESARAVSDTAKNTAPVAAPAPTAAQPAMVDRSDALSAGEKPPVANERVAEIRAAVKDGSYPLVPTTVADAMIAAGFMLIEGNKE